MNFELAFKAQFEGPLMMIRHDGMAIEGGGTLGQLSRNGNK